MVYGGCLVAEKGGVAAEGAAAEGAAEKEERNRREKVT